MDGMQNKNENETGPEGVLKKVSVKEEKKANRKERKNIHAN